MNAKEIISISIIGLSLVCCSVITKEESFISSMSSFSFETSTYSSTSSTSNLITTTTSITENKTSSDIHHYPHRSDFSSNMEKPPIEPDDDTPMPPMFWPPKLKFDYEFEQQRALEQEEYEQIEMQTKNALYNQGDFVEGYEITSGRNYKNTKVHWLMYSGNHIYVEIKYPNNFDENKQYPTIVLAHGMESSCATFIPFIDKLAEKDYIFVSFDFRGYDLFSRSDGSSLEVTFDTEIGALKAVSTYASNLPYVDKENMYLVGHSLGAVVSLLAIDDYRYSPMFKGITLLSPAISYLEKINETYNEDNIPETIKILNTTFSGNFIKSSLRHPNFNFVPMRYKGKLQIVINDLDDYVDNDATLNFAKKIPEKRLKVIKTDGPDHAYLRQENTQIIADAIENIILDDWLNN